MSSVSIWFDGGCKPHNPGGNGIYGFVIKIDGDTHIEDNGYLGKHSDMTNNVAEYTALNEALAETHTLDITPSHIHIHSDSELLVNQMKGDYNIYSPRLRPLYATAQTLVEQFDVDVQFQWVDRSHNERADELATQAYRDHAYQQQEQQALETPLEIKAVSHREYEIDDEHVVLPEQSCTCTDYKQHKAKCIHIFKAIQLENGSF